MQGEFCYALLVISLKIREDVDGISFCDQIFEKFRNYKSISMYRISTKKMFILPSKMNRISIIINNISISIYKY